MSLKIEENERLAALMTAQDMSHWVDNVICTPAVWRGQYQKRLREFMELETVKYQSCPQVGCELPMPHIHKIEGPAQAKPPEWPPSPAWPKRRKKK